MSLSFEWIVDNEAINEESKYTENRCNAWYFFAPVLSLLSFDKSIQISCSG